MGLALCRAPAASPLVVTGQSLVLLAAERFGDATPIALKLLVALNLLELTAQRLRRRDVVLGAGVVSSTYLVIGAGRIGSEPGDVLYKTALAVGAPLLVGAYLHSTHRLLLKSRERVAEAERNRLLAAQMARTAERTAISREVHDLVAHHVASIVLRVGVARHVVDTADDRVREVLDDVHETSARAMDDLRRLVAMLRQRDSGVGEDAWPMAPKELVPALEALAVNSRRAGVTVNLRIDPAVGDVDSLQAVAVLRIVQEGLTNTGKHAGPGTTVRVDVRREPWGGTTVDIADDGGVPASARPVHKGHKGHKRADAAGLAARGGTGSFGTFGTGHGIVGLRERATLLGGTFHAGPDATGTGWRVTATLPPVYSDGESAVWSPPGDRDDRIEEVGR
ncbi:histidine kinase [Yinghuangia sp. ASG 101]|uniref:sensor histidine kinase n=1 Tax=Yinghuangia sp. ASG 101 TaxID=2896848 RepID=UPI001E3250AB|nr:histidine kinase [Yinghuangia sp. ASG 101]UGQ11479.1 histidine kinase [Yinghuangia sp. ASG 101]